MGIGERRTVCPRSLAVFVGDRVPIPFFTNAALIFRFTSSQEERER